MAQKQATLKAVRHGFKITLDHIEFAVYGTPDPFCDENLQRIFDATWAAHEEFGAEPLVDIHFGKRLVGTFELVRRA